MKKQPMPTTVIDYQNHPDAPVHGAAKVFWLIDGQWVHKGWLMPAVVSDG